MLYTYSLDRQWATATSAVTSNYLRFATITLSFMRELRVVAHFWHTHTTGFIVRGSYKLALYTVLPSTVDGEILLLQSRTWVHFADPIQSNP